MLVNDLTAAANPLGGRIDLSWTNPTSGSFGGVRVLRRQTAFPGTGDPGEDQEIANLPAVTYAAGAFVQYADDDLKGETIYYYAVVPYDAGSNPLSPAYASAMSTTSYQSATHLYSNLPAVYRRYDTRLPPSVPELDARDAGKGQLQRLIELIGPQFDLLRSFASGQANFHNRTEVDGMLLSLLASWIDWETNRELGLDKQRNEIQYATHFFRTTGIAASLRATVNRLVTWDARIKEFVHNVFSATMPEQLTIWEKQNISGVWQDDQRISLDVAYEGRPAALQTSDRRQWLFHHARQTAPLGSGPSKTTRDHFHIWYKILERDNWLAAHRVSFSGEINKYPTAVEDDLKRVWVFWSGYQEFSGQSIPSIQLGLVATGEPARTAQARIAGAGPFAFSDGDVFEIKVTTPSSSFNRRVLFRANDFANMATATLAETVAVLEREIPEVQVTTNARGAGVLTTFAAGAGVKLEFPASAVGTKLGLTATVTGSDAVPAQMISSLNEPFAALTEGDAISIRIDDRLSRVVTFTNVKPGGPSAAEVAATINNFVPDLAKAVGTKVQLTSPTVGSASAISIEVFPPLIFSIATVLQPQLDAGTISPALKTAFARAQSTLSAAATLSVETAGASWLITDGGRNFQIRREGTRISVYNTGLAAPKLGFGVPLPAAPAGIAQTEPSAMKDGAGRIWLFWSSRRTGVWKIWYSRCDGTTWGTPKSLTTGAEPDREPFSLFVPAGGGRIWVFWSRKKGNRWNVLFNNTTTQDFNTIGASWQNPAPEFTPAPTTYDNREPSAIIQTDGAEAVEVYFSSNQTDGWHVWSRVITPPAVQSADTQINSGEFTQRAPVVLKISNQLRKLFFRSNESELYQSAIYPLTQTIDARYSGSTTVDTRNTRKISLRNNIKDIQRYTYDTVKRNDRWYARDTVGIYLVPDTIDQALVIRRRDQIAGVLRDFLPIQVRTVFIVDEVYPEFVYTYDAVDAGEQVLIGERVIETILGEVPWGPLIDLDRGPAADWSDSLPGIKFLKTFDAQNKDGLLPDLSALPPNLGFRLFLQDVDEGE